MKRIVTALVVVVALAVPAIGSAGTATKQVKRTQVSKRVLQTAGIPELGGARVPKAPTRVTITRSYRLLKFDSGACGTETYVIVVDGRAGIPMC